MTPRISILIPTRERAFTLAPCIRTCLSQNYGNFEIIVSDNASGPDTKAVVDAIDDKRIRYFHHEKRISMRQNFEFALSKATGDYVIIIGDDDGLAPNALARIGSYLELNPVDVLNWIGVVYYWPSLARDGQGFLMCKYQKMFGGLKHINPAVLLQRFASGAVSNYIYGAAIYHGCVSRRLVEPMTMTTGNYFNDHMPDVYACIAQLYHARSMVRLHHPLSISGVSAASTGSSFFAEAHRTRVDGSETPYERFAREASSDPGVFAPYNTDVRSAQYFCIQSMLIANQLFGDRLKIDIDAWADIVVAEVRKSPSLLEVTRGMNINTELDRRVIERLPPANDAPLPQSAANSGGLYPKRRFNRFDMPTSISGEDTVLTAQRTLERIMGAERRIDIPAWSQIGRPLEWARFVARGRSIPLAGPK